jgi:S1-C subfamily serine protease
MSLPLNKSQIIMNRLSLFVIAMVLIYPTTHAKALNVAFNVGYLGISSEKVSKQKAQALGFDNPYGSYVTKIWPNTPAAKGQLQIFDYIYGIDGQFTERYKDLDDLLKFKEPGEVVVVHFIRKQQAKTTRVTLGQRSNTFYSNTADEQKGFLGVTDDCSCPEGEIGITVGIVYNSTAQKMGLKDGDIITAINDFPIYDWADINTAISNTKPGDPVSVIYRRNGRTLSAVATLKSLKATRDSEYAEKKRAKPAFLGIYSSEISREKARKLGFDSPHGSYVSSVIPNTAAEKANIQAFDYIYGIDEYRVGENQNLGDILAKYREGETAKVYVLRKGSTLTKQIVLGARPTGEIANTQTNECEDPFFGVRNNYRNFSEKGVSVTIVGNSTAEEMGMQNGDVITFINDHPIIDWTDISIAIDNMKVGQSIKVIYLRNGRPLQSSHPIKSHCETLEEVEKSEIIINSDGDAQIIVKGRDANQAAESRIRMRIFDPTSRDLSNLSYGAKIKIDRSQKLEVQNLILKTTNDPDRVRISFRLPGRGDTQIQIYNQNGRSLYQYELDSFSGVFQDVLDIAQNGSGVYYLYIQQDQASLIKKILLQKQ